MFTTSEYLYLFGASDPCNNIRASMFSSVVLLVFLHRKNLSFCLCHTNTYIHGRSKLAATEIETEIKVDVIFFSQNNEHSGLEATSNLNCKCENKL